MNFLRDRLSGAAQQNPESRAEPPQVYTPDLCLSLCCSALDSGFPAGPGMTNLRNEGGVVLIERSML